MDSRTIPYGIQPHSIWTKAYSLWIPWTGSTWTPWTGSTWTPWTGPHGLTQNRTEYLLIILVSKCRVIDKIMYFVQRTGSCHVTCSHANQCDRHQSPSSPPPPPPPQSIPRHPLPCPPPLQVKTRNDAPRTATRHHHGA